MFLLNSRMGQFNATLSRSTGEQLHANRAPLIPKLRGQLAEFLNESYFERLSMFCLSTCVGLGTVTRMAGNRGFSRQRSVDQFARSVDWAPTNLSSRLRGTTGLDAHIQQRDGLAFCVTLHS